MKSSKRDEGMQKISSADVKAIEREIDEVIGYGAIRERTQPARGLRAPSGGIALRDIRRGAPGGVPLEKRKDGKTQLDEKKRRKTSLNAKWRRF
jgi:hypothetical protein